MILNSKIKQRNQMRTMLYWLSAVVFCALSCTNKQFTLEFENSYSDPPVIHGLSQLETLMSSSQINVRSRHSGWIIKTHKDSTLGPESYSINSSEDRTVVTGGDAVGIMYGLLYIKEQLESGKSIIADIQESPRLSFRAIKFNLPWDSYRNGPALDLHMETCRDTVFWLTFLNMMAENRFNKLTLWNLHPFNYLVKTEKYPEACGFTDDELGQWQSFWTSLFRMAKERGIETYLINWNIFVSPEFAMAHQVAEYCIRGDYFVEQGDTSEIIKDYTRECVREVIDQYPDLTGLGITLGEGMGGMTAEAREEWLLESFIEGMRMASRRVKFIHRVPLSAGTGSGGSTNSAVEKMTRATLDTLTCAEGPINIELKFNWSHAYSCTDLVKVHGGKLTDAYWNPPPSNYRLAWMMRNEDFFVLRWGQPDFIRDHISKNAMPMVNGYFVGSECYIPAKDYFTAQPNSSYRYAFDRQWMYYKNWGRLMYNPGIPNSTFSDVFESRFPGFGVVLFEAQKMVSQVPLIIASYWNATWDYTLYSEGMISLLENDKMKLISLKQMCDKQPMAPNYLSIKEWLSPRVDAQDAQISPLQLSDSLEGFCSSAIKTMQKIRTEHNVDLHYEVSDIQTWAYLGLYFANKLKAAVSYQQFLNTSEKKYLRESISWLEQATEHWHQVVQITSPIYRPMPLQHYERNDHALFHWSKVEAEVTEELNWLKSLDI